MSKATTRSTQGTLMEVNPLSAALEWRRKCALARRGGAATLSLRYEDLMADGDGALARIADALGLTECEREKSKSAQQYAQGIGQQQQHLHVRVGGDAERARVDGWRTRIDPWDARVFDRVAAATLTEFGYAPFDAHPPGVLAWLRTTARLLRCAGQLGVRYVTSFARPGSLAARVRDKLFALNVLRAR